MASMHVDKLIQSNDFISFLTAARDYCGFIETNQTENQQEFLSLLQNQLLSLYQNGLNLQFVDLNSDLDYDDLLATEYLTATLQKLDKQFKKRYYWHVFDPSDDSNIDAVCGDLLDDIGDIYKDLKNALLLFDKGGPEKIENAAWTFKWTFDHHWGEHCMNAMYSLHYFIRRTS